MLELQILLDLLHQVIDAGHAGHGPGGQVIFEYHVVSLCRHNQVIQNEVPIFQQLTEAAGQGGVRMEGGRGGAGR